MLTAVEIIIPVTNIYARTDPIPAKQVRHILDALVNMCDIRDPTRFIFYFLYLTLLF